MAHPFEALRLIAEDEVSGATRITKRAARVLSTIEGRRELLRASRLLLRAKGTMAPLWRLCSLALEGSSPAALRGFATSLEDAQQLAARNARWIAGSRRPLTLVTWSNASALPLVCAQLPIAEIRCMRSDGHGTRLAASLRRAKLDASVFDDLELMETLRDADALLLGADAIGARIGNALGSELACVAARALQVPVYAIAAEAKLLPATLTDRVATGAFESFDASRLDAVITEHGPRSPRWLSARGEQVAIASGLRALLR